MMTWHFPCLFVLQPSCPSLAPAGKRRTHVARDHHDRGAQKGTGNERDHGRAHSSTRPSQITGCHGIFFGEASHPRQHLTPSTMFGGSLTALPPLQLILPETSKRFPTQDGEIFETTRRWFDFSNSVMPLPDFEGFANNSKICKPRARFQEESAFYLEGANFRRHCFHVVARLCSPH